MRYSMRAIHQMFPQETEEWLKARSIAQKDGVTGYDGTTFDDVEDDYDDQYRDEHGNICFFNIESVVWIFADPNSQSSQEIRATDWRYKNWPKTKLFLSGDGPAVDYATERFQRDEE